MTLKRENILLGTCHILIFSLSVFPFTIGLLKSGGGGFGFGLIFVPTGLMLSFASVFGLFAFINYDKYAKTIARILISYFSIIFLAGLVSLFIFPFPSFLLVFPLGAIIPYVAGEWSVGRKIFLINAVFLSVIILLIILEHMP